VAKPVPPAPARPAEAGKPVQDETAAVAPAVLSEASRAESAAARPAPRIRAVRLVGVDTTVKLGIGTFMIGRTATADVRLEDRQVSRQHATITVAETTVTVEDLQTVNGTLVNGREVKGREVLRDGDTVLFGASEFKVEVIAS
jgi:pSer/pThr/pTyr-binding forkhead associated (FHA) protein